MKKQVKKQSPVGPADRTRKSSRSSSEQQDHTKLEAAIEQAVRAARAAGGDALADFDIVVLRREQLRLRFGRELAEGRIKGKQARSDTYDYAFRDGSGGGCIFTGGGEGHLAFHFSRHAGSTSVGIGIGRSIHPPQNGHFHRERCSRITLS